MSDEVDQDRSLEVQAVVERFLDVRPDDRPDLSLRSGRSSSGHFVLSFLDHPVAALPKRSPGQTVFVISPAYDEFGAVREMVWFGAENRGRRVRMLSWDDLAARVRDLP
jgi:hypothetical protein